MSAALILVIQDCDGEVGQFGNRDSDRRREDTPVPGASKAMTRRSGNCSIRSSHMSTLPPSP